MRSSSYFLVGIGKNKHISFKSFRITSVAVNILNDFHEEIDMAIAGSKAPQNSCHSLFL